MRSLFNKIKWAANQRPSGVGRTLLLLLTILLALAWLFQHSKAGLTGVLVGSLGCGAWALFVEPRKLRRRHFIHPVQGLKPNQRLRLAILGDLHVGALHFGEQALRRVIERVQTEQVEMLILVGDYVIQRMPGGRPVPIEKTAAMLAETGLPTVAILGNHDIWEGRQHIETALNDAGIETVVNHYCRLRIGDMELCVVGLDDESTGQPNPAEAFPSEPPTGPLIILAHDPATFKREMPRTGDLLLSGHTHGGQVRIPGLGAILIPSHAPLKWALGWSQTNAGPLYVTAGLGTSVLPIRFLCPPEYVIIDLVPISTDPEM